MRDCKQDITLIEQFVEFQDLERARISRDLHDSLAQEISMVRMYWQSLLRLEKGTESFEKRAAEVDTLLEKAIASVREIAHNLSPRLNDACPISEALSILVDKIRNATNTQIEFKCPELVELSNKSFEVHIYRTIQEFIHNSLKHAEATTIRLEVNQEKNHVEFLISDNGKGFQIENKYSSIGVSNIQMRMQMIGAKYEYYSIPDVGTDLRILIPR